jgi:DNA polymerase elongation subunit (family B)
LVKKSGPAFTIASQAIKVFRLYLTHDIKSLDKKTDDFVRKSYFGGRTEVFKPEYNSKTKPIYCYDVNSLYPTVMRENEFPTNFQYMSRVYDKNKMGFWECDVEVPD